MAWYWIVAIAIGSFACGMIFLWWLLVHEFDKGDWSWW
jgi:hypothetical protein